MDYFQITAVVEAWQAPTFVPIGDKSNVSGSVQTNHSYILPFKLLHWKSISIKEIAKQDVNLISYALVIMQNYCGWRWPSQKGMFFQEILWKIT